MCQFVKGLFQFATLDSGVFILVMKFTVIARVKRLWSRCHRLCSFQRGVSFDFHEDAAWICVEPVSIVISSSPLYSSLATIISLWSFDNVIILHANFRGPDEINSLPKGIGKVRFLLFGHIKLETPIFLYHSKKMYMWCHSLKLGSRWIPHQTVLQSRQATPTYLAWFWRDGCIFSSPFCWR